MSQASPTDVEVDVYAQEFIAGSFPGDKSKAWRKAYPNSKGSDKNVWEKACTFDKLAKVRQRCEELQGVSRSKAEAVFNLSVEDLQKSLAMVIKKGLVGERPQLSAVVSAVSEVNKMNGNHSPVSQKVDVTSGGNKLKGFNDFYGD